MSVIPGLADSPYFTAGHRALAAQALAWATREALPRQWWSSDDETRKVVRLLAGDGWLDWCVVAVQGGRVVETHAALDARAMAVVREALAAQCGLFDLAFIMQALGSLPISLAGSPQQQARWLPQVRTGQAITAFALTEPDAGSDVASLSTRAVLDGDHYVVNGRKKFISQAPLADLLCLFVRTQDTGPKGLTALVVERASAGLTVVPQVPMAPHPLGEVVLQDVRVPVAHRLGNEGEGMRLALRTLDACRPTVAAAACGMARRALEEALQRATTRHQFGKPLADQQLVAQKLARMVTQLSAAQLLTARACAAVDAGGDATFPVSQAKLFATEAAWSIIDDAVQVFGGDGVVVGSVVERLYREIRALRIYEGTSEIQHLVIARALTRG
jgi:acyl-CoA dehydrogenase